MVKDRIMSTAVLFGDLVVKTLLIVFKTNIHDYNLDTYIIMNFRHLQEGLN